MLRLIPKMNSIGKGKSGSVEDYNIKNFRKEIDVNLIGAFICIKVFGKDMAKRNQGSNYKHCFRRWVSSSRPSNLSPTRKYKKIKTF